VTLNSKIRFFSTIFCFILLVSSCKNDKNDVIPDVTVSFSISINDPQFTTLNAFGNAALINKYTNNLGLRAAGFDENGIIIFSWIDYEYYAYDRTCPHDYAENNLSVPVNIDPENSMNAICPECGTNYSLSAGGTPAKGIGRYPLKNYKTSFDGVNIFVSNY
jgi:nitrite reductase/ring-hydroxylating ferredoxin subunit